MTYQVYLQYSSLSGDLKNLTSKAIRLFLLRIAAIPSMIHVAIWGKEEDSEFNDFII